MCVLFDDFEPSRLNFRSPQRFCRRFALIGPARFEHSTAATGFQPGRPAADFRPGPGDAGHFLQAMRGDDRQSLLSSAARLM
jgi:hypothetical protein